MSNFEKFILAVSGLLIIIVLLFGIMIFRLQKDVAVLKNGLVGSSGKVSSQAPKNLNAAPPAGVLQQFSGSITDISGNQLTADIKLPDYSKPKKLKGSEGGGHEIIDKKITVNTNEKTVFEKKALADLKAGDSIFIFSHDSPYSSDTVTADKVTYIQTKSTP